MRWPIFNSAFMPSEMRSVGLFSTLVLVSVTTRFSIALGSEVAKLLGVRVGRMFTLGWALESLVGSLAGVLVAPSTFLGPKSFDPILIGGFVAAVLGGLDSPPGAVIGGLILGLALSYVSGYEGSALVPLAALVILMLVLMIRPSGLFSTTTERRV